MIIQLIDNSGMIYMKGMEVPIEQLIPSQTSVIEYVSLNVDSIEKNELLEKPCYFVNCSTKINGTEEKYRLTIFQPISILEKIDQERLPWQGPKK